MNKMGIYYFFSVRKFNCVSSVLEKEGMSGIMYYILKKVVDTGHLTVYLCCNCYAWFKHNSFCFHDVLGQCRTHIKIRVILSNLCGLLRNSRKCGLGFLQDPHRGHYTCKSRFHKRRFGLFLQPNPILSIIFTYDLYI